VRAIFFVLARWAQARPGAPAMRRAIYATIQ